MGCFLEGTLLKGFRGRPGQFDQASIQIAHSNPGVLFRFEWLSPGCSVKSW